MRRLARKATQNASFSASTGTGRILRRRLDVQTIFSFGMQAQKFLTITGKERKSPVVSAVRLNSLLRVFARAIFSFFFLYKCIQQE